MKSYLPTIFCSLLIIFLVMFLLYITIKYSIIKAIKELKDKNIL